MSNVVWPAVLDRLRSLAASTLTGVEVFDGLPLTGDALTSYVVVGGDATGEAGAGGFDTEITTLGIPFRVEERGRINGLFVAQTGDTDPGSTRATAFGLLESLVDAINSDPSMGLSYLVSSQIDTGAVSTGQSSTGSFTEITFAFTYNAVTGA